MWFLVALLSTIILNYLSRHLILKFKYLLIIPLRSKAYLLTPLNPISLTFFKLLATY